MTEKDELFFQSVVDAYHACHESLRDTAKAMQLSRTKVRKILITMGAIESDITERALALREKGYAREEIADALGVSAATLSTYMPYGERVYNREEKTKNAIRVKNCLARQAIAAENQVGRGMKKEEIQADQDMMKEERMLTRDTNDGQENVVSDVIKAEKVERRAMEDGQDIVVGGVIKEKKLISANDEQAEKERMMEMEGMKDGKVLKLHLELMDFDEEELEVLRKYGRAQNGISRDILVPAEMPLHNLHYAIQKAFGWQNSHLHQFRYEEELFDGLFDDHFITWMAFCGLYFRFPSNDVEDDYYWDDDYEEGYSVKSWLRSKYTGPYYYGGKKEHFMMAQMRARIFLEENKTVEIGPSFDEHLAGKKGRTSYKIEEVTMEAMKRYFIGGMNELLERVPVGQLIGMEQTNSEELTACVKDALLSYNANLKKLAEGIQRKADLGALLEATDYPVLPLSDCLIYRYDYGDDWTVKISIVGEAEGELRDRVLKEERPICVAADGLPVMDDAGGVHGYCEFLKTVKGKAEDAGRGAFESKEDAKAWGRMMGWTGRMSKAENIL